MSKELELEIRNIQYELSEIDEQIQALVERRHELKVKEKSFKKLIEENNEIKSLAVDWTKTDFSWSSKLTEVMKKSFNISSFRPYQLEAINATMSGSDCILIMPTGGGKSLCYQLPALISDGVTVVVSPLVSLMEDQTHCMKSIGLGHTCDFLSATKTTSEVSAILKAMTDSQSPLKILFVTPEKVTKSKRFMAKLEKMYSMGRFKRLTIDEIHCISQWGHDFRPDYKILGIMKKQFADVPILGLTATLTSKVSADVKTILGIQGCVQFKASFNRPNLMYEVHSKFSSQNEVISSIVDLIKKRYPGECGIIYCVTIKDCEDVASELRKRNLCAAPYHAQLNHKYRSQVHSDWLAMKTKIVVATIAFGMGINKSNVRFVIHHSLSKSMENYYQESGRAGRDGEKADCIVFYRLNDLFRLSTMVFKDFTGLENLYAMAAYCVSHHKCRRVMIAEHFGEAWDKSQCQKMCDSCKKNRDDNNSSEVDLTDYCLEVYAVISNAKQQDQRLTALKIVDCMVRKKGTFKKQFNHLSREENEHLITLLLLEGYLKEDFHFTAYTVISYLKPGIKSTSVTNGKHSVKLALSQCLRQSVLKCGSNKKAVANKDTKTSKVVQNGQSKTKNCEMLKQKSTDQPISKSKTKGVVFVVDESDDDIAIIEQPSKKIKTS